MMEPSREIMLSDGSVAIVDEADYPLISQWKWKRHRNGYAYRNSRSKKPGKKWKNIYMHRVIAGATDDEDADHIDLDRLNNRRGNLRCVPHFVNSHNRSSANGVTKPRGRNRWQAVIYIQNTRHWLGSFETESEARAAYQLAKENAGLTVPQQPARLWMTPKARDADFGTPSTSDRTREMSTHLATQVMWATPQHHDHHAGDPNRVGRFGTKHGGRNLNDEVLLPTAQVSPGRNNTSGRSNPDSNHHSGETIYDLAYREGGKLNPDWVCRMMGFPDGWLEVP